MCAHYQGLSQPQSYTESFAVAAPTDVRRTDIWPGYESAFIRRPLDADAGDVPPREALKGLFGLVPHWSRDLSLAKRTYNARSETVADKPSFRDAWRLARHCIVPLEAFFEPDWRSGRAVATRISHVDGQPLGLAGLWTAWQPPQGALVHSFTAFPVGPEPLAFLHQVQPQRWGAEIFATGLWIALPLVTMLLFVNLVLGAISRVAPQINIFAIGFPVTLGVGLLGLLLTLPALSTPFTMTLERLLEQFR
jgi:putative SOS response-associated peptidase YedK